MKVQFLPFAESDLEEIGEWIAQHNPTRARTFIEELYFESMRIAASPYIHRLRPEFGEDVRAAVHGNYLILYDVQPSQVTILRIINGARDLDGVLLR